MSRKKLRLNITKIKVTKKKVKHRYNKIEKKTEIRYDKNQGYQEKN